MNPFEFVLVLIAIILGLALTDLLSTLSRVLRGEVEGGTLHSVWMLWIGTSVLQQFWSRWSQVDRPDWSTVEVTVFLLPALLAYLAASLLSPTESDEKRAMDDAFMERRVPFYVVNIVMMLSFSLEDRVLMASNILEVELIRAILIGLLVVAIWVPRRGVQLACGVLLTATGIAFAVGWTSSLSTNAALPWG